MKSHSDVWRLRADELLSCDDFDVRSASRLLTDIVDQAAEASVVESAKETLAALRGAAAFRKGSLAHATARNHFDKFRREMNREHPRPFGRRERADMLPFGSVTGEHRRALGLPAWGHVSDVAIREAYRKAAKSIHPDAGGCADAFLKLVAARDHLLAHAKDPGPDV